MSNFSRLTEIEAPSQSPKFVQDPLDLLFIGSVRVNPTFGIAALRLRTSSLKDQDRAQSLARES